MKLTSLLAVVYFGMGTAALAQFFPTIPPPLPPVRGNVLPIPMPPVGFPGGAPIPILDQFDKSKDGWLNAEERAAARQYLATQPARGSMRQAVPTDKGATVRPAEVSSYPDRPFYDERILRTLFLTFEESDWEKELAEFRNTDVDVAATLAVDGKTYRDVGVRFRGLSSYGGVPEGQKHSMNLSIDMVHEDQAVGGYRTLNLLNAHEDPTLMRAVLYLHVAREYIPAPKANFVRVVINGEDWGIFESVQQFNKDFIKENFKDTGGARWKAPGPNPRAGLQYLGENVDPYKLVFEIKTKDDPAQWAALINLTRVLSQTPIDQLEQALSPILDVDGVLRFLALEMVFVNSDGYWSRGSDYSLYRDTAGKFHIIPHDTNETFSAMPTRGRGPRGPGNTGLDPLMGLNDLNRPLRSRLLSVPTLQQKYLGYVREIAAKWL
ncbi:MAG TPA: CotH kinase family protein, partial [Terriglobia bacterium]|nr:CotH kinase family protein [Terriglobia bacterium]